MRAIRSATANNGRATSAGKEGGKSFGTVPRACLKLREIRKNHPSKQKAETFVSAFQEKLAATYSRGVYKTTTIGKTVFDGRVRKGIGSDHSFMATKKYLKEQPAPAVL